MFLCTAQIVIRCAEYSSISLLIYSVDCYNKYDVCFVIDSGFNYVARYKNNVEANIMYMYEETKFVKCISYLVYSAIPMQYHMQI